MKGERLLVDAGGLSFSVQTRAPVAHGERSVISLERQVRIAAGALVLLGTLAGVFIHPAGYWLAGFIGAGLAYAGVTNFCGMSMLLARMPWNQTSPQIPPRTAKRA